jgi:hypothetical protein
MSMRWSSWRSVAVGLCCLIACVVPGPARALKAPAPLSELEEADHKALETVAGHSETLRDAVLKASLHVDALVETQRIQEQSSASFQDRIGKLDKKQQEQIWELVREPQLLDELATEDTPSRAELDAIAERHPDSLSDAIHSFGAKHHDLLVDIADVHHRASDRFDAVISDFDEDTQQAFRKLVDEPELLSVLVRRVNLVVRLGDSYRKHPKDTRSYLAALADDVAKRSAESEKEWKKRIESDPKAAAELDQAARDYADERGYDYDELTSPEVRNRVVVVVNPYPFWFGYPIWYSDVYYYPYGYWYPYPLYFGYYRAHRNFVWFGFPSLVFMDWFYVGHHHNHYAYLSNCFRGYYRDYRYAPTYYNVTVSNFVRRSDPIDQHRGDWSRGRGHGRADRAVGGASARYAGRDSGFLFNRYRPEDRLGRLDRRAAPGERGATLGDRQPGTRERPSNRGRGRDAGQVAPQGSNTRGAATRGGRERSRFGGGSDSLEAREIPGAASPRPNRGSATTSRGRSNRHSNRSDAPRFFDAPAAPAGPSAPADRRRGSAGPSRRSSSAPSGSRDDTSASVGVPPQGRSRSGGERGSAALGSGRGESRGGSGGGIYYGRGGGRSDAGSGWQSSGARGNRGGAWQGGGASPRGGFGGGGGRGNGNPGRGR